MILLIDGTEVPFDVNGVRWIRYSRSNLSELKARLVKHIRSCLECKPQLGGAKESKEGPNVRIVDIEAPDSAVTGGLVEITIKAKNLGLHAEQGYFSVSLPSGASNPRIVSTDVHPQPGFKGDHWKSRQVILNYPILEAQVYPSWPTKTTHQLTVSFVPRTAGLLQFYVAASSKSGSQSFVNDPPLDSRSLLDQRDEPVYCGVIEVREK